MRRVTVRGIALEVDLDRFDDPRFTYALGQMSSDELNAYEKLRWANRMLDTLFGGRAYEVMCELAERNGGRLSVEQWGDFYAEVMEAVSAKN